MTRHPAAATEVRERLEDAVRPALLRPPCFVTFSGGVDSSLVLAVAASVARREGHDLPIPVTFQFPAGSDAHENEWQALVLGHLRLERWERLVINDEFALAGDVHREFVEAHGVVWPPLAYKNSLVYRRAQGGTILTGEGGDEVLGGRRVSAVRNLRVYRRVARPRHVAAAVEELLPYPLRVLRASAAQWSQTSWLTPSTRLRAANAVGRDVASEPLDFARAILRLPARRASVVGRHNLAVLANRDGCRLEHPLLDTAFLQALGAFTGRWGLRDRGSLVRAVFPDLLPEALTRRTTKAVFNDVTFTDPARRFARTWRGEGVDHELVNWRALREAWLGGEEVSARTYMLFHQAFEAKLQEAA